MSARPTDASDGSCSDGETTDESDWPTPTASDYGSSQNGICAGKPSGGTPSPQLREQAMWPTACTTDAASSGRATTTTDVMHPGTSLTDAMRSSFSITDGRPAPPTRKGGRGGPVLDPRFVEALMGFPPGWTVPDSPRDFAALACELLETRSSPSKLPEPSRSSSLELFTDEDEP